MTQQQLDTLDHSQIQILGAHRLQKKPELFFTEVLGIETLESYQKKLIQAIADNERVAISAAHDLGKSYSLARILLWYMSCFPGAKVITTAPTFNMVKNILWSEVRSAYSKSKMPLGGKMNLTEWQMTPQGDWFAIGFTPRNEVIGETGQGTQSNFQGFHAPYLMVIFDEATGIPSNIWTMAEGMLTSSNVKFVCIGNPTSRASEFFKCFSSPSWEKIKLSCFDSPNLIVNEITNKEKLIKEIQFIKSLNDHEAKERFKSYKVVKPYLLTLKWVISSAIKWGIDHPLFISKVLGEFPNVDANALFPLGIIEDAQRRVHFPTSTDRKVLGVDVARFGADASVLTALHGKKFLTKKSFFKKDLAELTGEIIALGKEIGPFDVIVVDGTGIGSGVVDMLRQNQNDDTVSRNTEIREVQFGAACEDETDKEKYVNLKARMFGLLRDDLKDNEGLCLSDDEIYLDELPTILYSYDSKGKLKIESKDDYKKRTGRGSPDNADSLALANFGRHDEIVSANYNSSYNQINARPMAGGLGTQRQW